MRHNLLSLLSVIPTPGPTDSAAAKTTDPMTYLVPIAVAVVGLLGLAVAAWIAARSAIRVRIVDMLREQGEAERAFQVRTVSAVNELLIAMGQLHLTSKAIIDAATAAAHAQAVANRQAVVNVSVQVPHDPDQLKRVTTATTEWRSVIAESHYHADQELAEAIQTWDTQRDAVVRALNSASVREFMTAEAALKRLGEVETRQLYRVLQVRKVQSILRVAHALRVVRLHRYNVKWEAQLRGVITQGQELIAGGAGA